VKEPIVLDSTCLIGLERIGQLDILSKLFKPIVIPDEVGREFGNSFNWLNIETPSNIALISSLKILVDNGEAEAIALALEKNCKIVLDDKQARSMAKRLRLKVIGTIGIFIRAKQNGSIPMLGPILEDLENSGFRMSTPLKVELSKLLANRFRLKINWRRKCFGIGLGRIAMNASRFRQPIPP